MFTNVNNYFVVKVYFICIIEIKKKHIYKLFSFLVY